MADLVVPPRAICGVMTESASSRLVVTSVESHRVPSAAAIRPARTATLILPSGRHPPTGSNGPGLQARCAEVGHVLVRRRRGVGPRPAPPGQSHRVAGRAVVPAGRRHARRAGNSRAPGLGVSSNYVAAGADTAGMTSAEFALVVVHDVPAHGVGTGCSGRRRSSPTSAAPGTSARRCGTTAPSCSESDPSPAALASTPAEARRGDRPSGEGGRKSASVAPAA